MEEIVAAAMEAEDKEILLDEMMNRYGQEILQLVYSYVKDKSIAEDLTQDIFVKCFKSFDTFNGKSKLRTWLWRIAINHCKDFLRSWYKKNVVITNDDSMTDNGLKMGLVEETVVQKEEDDQLIQAIMMLPIKYREVIYLFYYEELPIKEIAVLTDTGDNTVKTRLRRAKELLKERLEDL
ncbi:sigma-70 family RNA polymerase sigma factor [Neobacillus sp. D3-1R]|uniref:sigma-70 family RNA polymerase sigma factor n=1 Tax=Neobacillus sp. D3-1R TaxID=3445778 RepID=UPI003F9F4C78